MRIATLHPRNPAPHLCYTCADMSERGAKSSIIEALLCLWIIGAQLWYLLQFRPLLAFFAAKLLHHS